jgi:hypothetical protein
VASVATDKLKIDRDLFSVDLRLRPHLAALAAACPCPCSLVGGSRELDLAELPAETLEEDIKRLQHHGHKSKHDPGAYGGGLKSLDCSNGGTTVAIKKLFTGLIRSSEDKSNKNEEKSSKNNPGLPSAPPASSGRNNSVTREE